MKIKNYINQFVAILTVVTLVSGFQISTNEGTVNTFESVIGIEEAYAGPCGRRGCEGRVGDCDGTSYTIFAIGDLEIYRYCKGIKKSEDQFEEEG